MYAHLNFLFFLYIPKGVTPVSGTEGFSFPSPELLGTMALALLLLVVLITNSVLCCHYRRRHGGSSSLRHSHPDSICDCRTLNLKNKMFQEFWTKSLKCYSGNVYYCGFGFWYLAFFITLKWMKNRFANFWENSPDMMFLWHTFLPSLPSLGRKRRIYIF